MTALSPSLAGLSLQIIQALEGWLCVNANLYAEGMPNFDKSAAAVSCQSSMCYQKQKVRMYVCNDHCISMLTIALMIMTQAAF